MIFLGLWNYTFGVLTTGAPCIVIMLLLDMKLTTDMFVLGKLCLQLFDAFKFLFLADESDEVDVKTLKIDVAGKIKQMNFYGTVIAVCESRAASDVHHTDPHPAEAQ